eukprot:CAMPEP_0182450976 /NCGR_PEP_ID=MMETSP1172-20130603/43467_1 /TAXON_ID=708627 /ORGANISM="Timspurckia oligopyrenoides, Strain CCMP3278" /LENGTH=394 /DNA_ID=CAMNT_0024648705 /DNA_START=44 /DNA_END=1228 /DNA_ORIENTATION=+
MEVERVSVDGMESVSNIVRCMACHVTLSGGNARVDHYRSDWHRVNLKRSTAGLVPMELKEFEERLVVVRAQQEAQEKAELSKRAKGFVCDICSKRFSSENAFQQHTASKRHIDKLNEGQSDPNKLIPVHLAHEDTEMLQARIEASVPIPPNQCVFDMHLSTDAEQNAEYMARKFGFFVPYVEHVADLTGLLTYLGEKVGVGYACVCCDRGFSSVSAVQSHMIAKSHCKMTPEDDLWMEEFAEWYDFGEEDGEEWEEVVGNEAEEYLQKLGADGTMMVLNGNHEDDEGIDVEGEEAVELVLANGKHVGHRSLKKYYDQSSKPGRSPQEAARLQRIMAQYKSLGWYSGGEQISHETQRKMREIRKRKDLKLGVKTYYTRKANVRPNMGVLNSGYRP